MRASGWCVGVLIVGFGLLSFCRDSAVPEPLAGPQWKEAGCVRTVMRLAAWTENVQNLIKYVTLNPGSKLKVRRV